MRIIRPITITPDDLGSDVLTDSNVAEADYSEYSSGTSYSTGNRVILTDTGYHRIYESLANSNSNNYPPDNPDKWLDVSATNRWKMFDGVTSNVTSNSTSIEVDLTPGEVVNAVALFNLSAESVDIVMDDPTDGEVYNQSFDLTDNSAVVDWYAYFFESITRKTDLAVFDLPAYSTAVITITITQTGGTAECGQLVLGRSAQIGTTNWGVQAGIIDYSIKNTDSFGNAYLLQRKFSKRATFDVIVEHPSAWVHRLLAQYRATPLAWIGASDDDYDITIIYGFYRDFSILLEHVAWSVCSIEVEGL